MNTLIIYTSKTGFTEKYARWLQEKTGGDLLSLKEAKGKEESYFLAYGHIIYAGWAMAGRVVDSQWFLERKEVWKDKKLVLICVGASPIENEEVDQALEVMLNEEEKNM